MEGAACGGPFHPSSLRSSYIGHGGPMPATLAASAAATKSEMMRVTIGNRPFVL
jgi:hypothetical protein